MKPAPIKSALALLALVLALSGRAEELRGKVVRILDGDTVELLTPDRKAVLVRLHGVDCPEDGQAFGAAAHAYTGKKCAGAEVVAQVVNLDRYGRTVAVVSLANGESLNHELVKAGFAWFTPEYSKDKTLAALEAEARAARRGLWSDLDTAKPPVRPSEYRKPKKDKPKKGSP